VELWQRECVLCGQPYADLGVQGDGCPIFDLVLLFPSGFVFCGHGYGVLADHFLARFFFLLVYYFSTVHISGAPRPEFQESRRLRVVLNNQRVGREAIICECHPRISQQCMRRSMRRKG